MKRFLVVVLIGATSCATSTPTPTSTPPRSEAAVEWTVLVEAPSDWSFSFLGVDEVVAGNQERPTIYVSGGMQFSTALSRATLERTVTPYNGPVDPPIVAKLRTEFSRGLFAVSSKTSEIAVVHDSSRLDCTTCEAVSVVALADGRRLRTFELALTSDRTTAISDRTTIGFDGRELWIYMYTPASGGAIAISREGCGYEVYDASPSSSSTGKRLRTLADARGTWAELTNECRVRALLPQPDGGVIAVRVDDHRAARAVKFTSAP